LAAHGLALGKVTVEPAPPPEAPHPFASAEEPGERDAPERKDDDEREQPPVTSLTFHLTV
jgi:hypothetical protein